MRSRGSRIRWLALHVLCSASALRKSNSNPSERLSVSNSKARVIVLAGAAALAGLGYTLGRRSGSRPVRPRRIPADSSRRSELRAPRRSPERSAAFDAVVPFADAERISSAPDALDVALDLDGVFDGDSASGVQVTARPSDHVSAPRSGDDEDAPAPEDLGRNWLEQATESEHGLGLADTLPDVENLPKVSRDLLESNALADDEDDETTAEYIRRHRLSSVG